ncbi:OmpA family protein [Gloeobacter kilaueensis]|uniref:OmpA/MotB domain-containing protein n=1 Tax=Gloeobacter kilaueensis (strain ATCC BAA-2537 / CCAP 1431/1 / ULC 316 / JS1) TaxID=1183438 RepID=U5QLB9_GLOK1|nr:OmpA family protein [Gloeobacter kilaueensis]AGY58460.1 OmpA/MotB domain-containing protein [Gloeobacter kilaueensis JS1]
MKSQLLPGLILVMVAGIWSFPCAAQQNQTRTVPTQTVPTVTVPSAPTPSVTVPNRTTPSVAVPNKTIPSRYVPTVTVPVKVVPSQVREAKTQLRAIDTRTETRIVLDADVLFDFDKDNIRPDAAAALVKVAIVLKGYPGKPVRIEGYTDSMGSDSYNLDLSRRRAAAVQGWLLQNARIENGRMRTTGFGESHPVAPNANPDGSDNPAGRQKNRRVEIVVRRV